MTEQMMIRLDSTLKDKVSRLAKSEGKTVSEVVRESLTNYAKTHDMAAYIDDLWDRTGKKLIAKGITLDKIPNLIKEVRLSK